MGMPIFVVSLVLSPVHPTPVAEHLPRNQKGAAPRLPVEAAKVDLFCISLLSCLALALMNTAAVYFL